MWWSGGMGRYPMGEDHVGNFFYEHVVRKGGDKRGQQNLFHHYEELEDITRTFPGVPSLA
jgi:hypothetical protein